MWNNLNVQITLCFCKTKFHQWIYFLSVTKQHIILSPSDAQKSCSTNTVLWSTMDDHNNIPTTTTTTTLTKGKLNPICKRVFQNFQAWKSARENKGQRSLCAFPWQHVYHMIKYRSYFGHSWHPFPFLGLVFIMDISCPLGNNKLNNLIVEIGPEILINTIKKY